MNNLTWTNPYGIDLTRARGQVRSWLSPIILCTGYSSRISEEKAGKLGDKHYTMKPVGITKLANIVRDVLDEH